MHFSAPGPSKIFVTTGFATVGGSSLVGSNSTEIIDIGSTTSQCANVQDYPLPITFWTVGGLGFKNEPVVCGSRNYVDVSLPECYSFINGGWSSYEFNRTIPGAFGMSFAFNPYTNGNGRILVVHGTYTDPSITTIESLSPTGWKQAPIDLPQLFVYSCTVAINSTTYVIVSVSVTLFYNVDTNTVTEGNPTIFPRQYLRCDL